MKNRRAFQILVNQIYEEFENEAMNGCEHIKDGLTGSVIIQIPERDAHHLETLKELAFIQDFEEIGNEDEDENGRPVVDFYIYYNKAQETALLSFFNIHEDGDWPLPDILKQRKLFNEREARLDN